MSVNFEKLLDEIDGRKIKRKRPYIEFNAAHNNAFKLLNALQEAFPNKFFDKPELVSPVDRVFVHRVYVDTLDSEQHAFVNGFVAGLNKEDYA